MLSFWCNSSSQYWATAIKLYIIKMQKGYKIFFLVRVVTILWVWVIIIVLVWKRGFMPTQELFDFNILNEINVCNDTNNTNNIDRRLQNEMKMKDRQKEKKSWFEI